MRALSVDSSPQVTYSGTAAATAAADQALRSAYSTLTPVQRGELRTVTQQAERLGYGLNRGTADTAAPPNGFCTFLTQLYTLPVIGPILKTLLEPIFSGLCPPGP
jgi:hypothetical protein